MANKPATEFLVELPTKSRKIRVTFEIDEADHKQVLDYLSYLTKVSGQEVTLDLVGTTAFRYLLSHDRLYRQLSGKAKAKKKATPSKPQSESPMPRPSTASTPTRTPLLNTRPMTMPATPARPQTTAPPSQPVIDERKPRW